MSTGVELATAWVRLVPSVEGINGKVAEAFAPAESEGQKSGDRTGKKFSAGAKAAMVAGGALAVAGVVGAFKGLYEIGATFDDVTDTIRVGTGAQGKDLQALTQIAKDVGSSVPASFDKIGPVVADLNTRLGLSGDTLKTVASQYLEAGRILGEDVDINSTTAAFNAFHLKGEDVIGGMDTLFQVSQATGVGMNELAGIVQSTAPALQNLGFSFKESASLAGVLDKAGLNSQQIMTSLGKGLVTLAKNGEQPQEAFKRVTSEIQGFIDKGDTASALDLAGKIFGTKGATQFIGALQSGAVNLDDLASSVGATGDSILGVGADTADFAEKAQVLGNQAQVALEPLASAVFTAMGDALTFVMPYLDAFGMWAKENTGTLIAIAGVIAGVLVAAMVMWTASVIANNIAWLANPVTWIILGIVAAIAVLIAIILLVIANWQNIVDFLSTVWSAIVDWLIGTLNNIANWWTSVWNSIASFFITIWTNISSFFQGIWNFIVAFVTAYINMVLTIIRTVITTVQSVWNSVWGAISSFFQGIWNGVVSTVSNVMNTVKNVISTALNFITSTWNGMWNGIVSFFGSVFGGIVGAAKGPINGVIQLINGAISALNSFKVTIPAWVPGIGGQTWGLSIPHIPMLATGGTITQAGYTIVGENGPELLKLPKGAQVNPEYDDVPTHAGFTFVNYAPLGSKPSDELETFSNRAEAFLP